MSTEIFLIALVIFIVLFAVQNIINTRKVNRAKQFAMPCLALLLSLASVFFGYSIMDKINSLEFLDFLKETPVWDWINPLLEQMKNAGLYVYNLLIVLCFIVIKAIFCPLCAFLWKKLDLTKHTSVTFYDYDTDYNEWFLMDRWCDLRRIIFAADLGVIIVFSVYLGLTVAVTDNPPVWSFVFPAAAVIVLSEIFNFLNGQTKREYEHSILGEDSYSHSVNNFYKIREVYENLLPEPLLSANTGIEISGKTTPADTIKQMCESGDASQKAAAEYFQQNSRFKDADNDNFKLTAALMKRKNVVVSSPFYRDYSQYMTLPVINTLMHGNKCLIVVGRNSVCEDVLHWAEEMIIDFSQTEKLWKISKIDGATDEWDVGILGFTELYNADILGNHALNFSAVDLVILIEPSMVLNTGQVGLSIVSDEVSRNGVPVYCVMDRNVEGLVDTISHVFRTEFVNVNAAPLPRCVYTGMTWESEGDFIRQKLFDKQTRYLGNGIELAAIAVKNQIPHVSWYSESKVPVKDIKWIAGQYYNSICRYMNVPVEQNRLYDLIDFKSELWSSSVKKESFIIAEDEFCNMFSTLRLFLSRGSSQSFVSVLSENYLLRDYMRCNKQLFLSNPNAIPSMVPDYSKTERNTLIKLLVLMTVRPVSEQEIIEEFRLVGLETVDPLDTVARLMRKYTYADSSIIRTHRVKGISDDMSMMYHDEYTISPELFNSHFADTLKPAYFIVEEEKYNEDYIDAKMFSHVVQNIMPGQFVTYDGKYYVVRHISPMNGVILRRASDLFTERKYYRQIRKYTFVDIAKAELLSSRQFSEMEINFLRTDFKVETDGYIEMKDNHDLRSAKVVDIREDPTCGTFVRQYHNKNMMRIRMPGMTEGVRFTFCLLLSEMLRSIFPDAWNYVAIVSKQPDDIDGMLNKMVYSVEGLEDDDECIYIIEDSEIDLGIIEAIDRNWTKLLEIVADYLLWHIEKMRESASQDPVPESIRKEEQAAEKKRNLFQRMVDKILRLVGKGPKEKTPVFEPEKVKAVPQETEKTPDAAATVNQLDEQPVSLTEADRMEDNEADASEEAAGSFTASEENNAHDEENDFLSEESDPELCHIDGTDIFENEGMPEDNELLELQFKALGLIPLTKTRYQLGCYLKFGFEEIDKRIRIDELKQYLRVRGLCNGSLTKARKRKVMQTGLLDLSVENHCGFCGLPLSAVSYEVLNDGRVRCNSCSASAITTVGEFKEIYRQTLGFMQSLYGIQYHFPIRIATTDAKTVARGAGKVFEPTTEFAGRVLGFASKSKNGYSILIENGSPRLATVDTMVHEMTHIWQYVNWNDKEITAIYKMKKPEETNIAKDIVYEGMAVWSAIQYLYQMGESYYAAQQEMLMSSRTDVYGAGFRLYAEKYPLKKNSELLRYTPFSMFPPLERDKVVKTVENSLR